MFDIKFYKKTYPLKQNIVQGKLSTDELKNIEKDVYLKCLENIIEEKEKKVNEYIQKVSTSY